MTGSTKTFRMRLPATSANLGSGFDAAAVALNFALQIQAEEAEKFSIEASGLDSNQCSRLENNLILGIYKRILESNAKPATPLAIRMHNEIPLGMGCGSSAAGRLAAVALAAHFGGLGWCDEQILEEVCALEGHPDNAAACWLGGFVAAANEGRAVHVARVEPPAAWRAIVVLPQDSLATSKARAVLPASYPSADVVANIQAVSMLGLAFAQQRGDLLRVAMQDRIHQPYRAEMCPMLPRLLPLAGMNGILGVGLSGAGPSVLVIVECDAQLAAASESILRAIGRLAEPRLLACCFDASGARHSLNLEP
ncbi:MAG TPA: homoserine kinase [Terracidiphilus sp.]|nr:homoserine kinase [Terracidiphilus sp.]